MHERFYLEESFSIPEIEKLLNHSLLSGGKRMRPMFAMLMGQLFGLSNSKMSNCAIAAELTHAAFLAHDDVIDEARLRRGNETINYRADNKRAVLAGDALLARVCEIVLEEPKPAIMKDLAWTIRQTVEGEWLQLESVGIAPLSLTHIEDVSFKKTGALLVWCARAAAHLSEQPADCLKLCDDLGKLIGVAFQLSDDILDFSTTSGKEYAKDYNEGLVNSVMSLVMQEQPLLAENFNNPRNKANPKNPPWRAEVLSSAIERIRSRSDLKLDLAIACIEKLFCAQASGSTAQTQARDQLIYFIESLKGRKH